MLVPAYYFDGKTSRRMSVTLAVHDSIAVITGDAQRQCPLSDLRVSERLGSATRKVTFPDGAYLEILDTRTFNMLLSRTGHEEPFIVRMQQSWRTTATALLATVALFTAGYVYGLPAFAKIVARALPNGVERTIGSETLAFLDKRIFAPTELTEYQQAHIKQRFEALVPPHEGRPDHEIIFRKSRVGPNAFALPSGQIVLTDELVRLVDRDDAVMAILCHELGHLQERHLVRRIIQASAIGAITTVLFGDASSVVANIPAVILDLQFSREAEAEADAYAIDMLKKNGIGLLALVHTFEKLKEESGENAPYLSSHPPTIERIERVRSAR